MNYAVNFLLESGVSLALLSLIYILFLRRDTFYRLNRIFLLVSVAFSIVLPFLKFRIYQPHPTMLAEVTVTPYRNLIEAVTIYGHGFSGSVVQSISSSQTIILVYFAGLLFFLGRLVLRLIQISFLIRKNNVEQAGLVKFVWVNKDFSPFSFLAYVFVNPNKKNEPGYDKMLAHELEHIKQGHSLDVLILEILTVLQWFNPFMWILKRVIRENHEFLADQAVLNSGISPAHYKHLLLNQAVGFQIEMANNFNSSLVKKRIKMISKINSSKYGKLKILLGVVVVFGLLTAFAFEEKQTSVKNIKQAMNIDRNEQVLQNTEDGQYVSGIIVNVDKNKSVSAQVETNEESEINDGISTVSSTTQTEIVKKSENKMNFVLEENDQDKKRPIVVNVDGKQMKIHTDNMSLEDVRNLFKSSKYDITVLPESNTINLKTKIKSDKSKGLKEIDGAPVFYIVEDMPEFPGGEEALRKYIAGNVKYPKVAQKNKIEGKVYVTFVVTKDGAVKGTRIARGVDPSLDKEAVRVISSLPKWKPGKQRGQAVNVSYTVPINFTLKDTKNEDEVVQITPQEKSDTEQVFFIVEEMPEFPGGEEAMREYIARNVKYPEVAQKNKIEGKVFVSFVVGKDGRVKNAKIARGVESSINNEALRVINGLPKWKPGYQRGKAVNVAYTVPINFALK